MYRVPIEGIYREEITLFGELSQCTYKKDEREIVIIRLIICNTHSSMHYNFNAKIK